MLIDARTPILIGAGQAVSHWDGSDAAGAPSPRSLASEAAQRALSDTGQPDAVAKAIDAVALYVGTFTPKAPPKTVSGDVKHGRQLYTSCAACHGPKGEGNSALHAPALAGQTDWYLVTELQDFQAGLRGLSPQDDSGTQMRAAASALPDEPAIKDVVAYINPLPRR